MRRPFEKFIQIEIVSLGVAIVFALFALIKGYFLLIIASIYFVVIGLICDALVNWQFSYRLETGKQFLRAIILFLLASYLLLSYLTAT